jgi:transcriptional regulator with XRE-family HTH domain
MLTTGNQLRAARALADIDQGELAKRAGININTVSSMEKRGAEILTSGLDKIRAVMKVLESEGIEFLNHGNPGVRLRLPAERDKVEVFSFHVYDGRIGDSHVSPTKRTLEDIRISDLEHIEGTGEMVDRADLDDRGRYRPK